jgi:hypothetical protein
MPETKLTTAECVAREAELAEKIDDTHKRLAALRTSLPELKAKEERGLAAHRVDGKAAFPTAEIAAREQAEAAIKNLNASLVTLTAEQAAARRATKLAEEQKDTADDYADLGEQIELARPLLAVCKRMHARQARRSGHHRSANGFPEITDERLESLSAFMRRETAPRTAPPTLPRDSMLVLFEKYYPGSALGSDLGHLCGYRAGEAACFETRVAKALISQGYATEVQP